MILADTLRGRRIGHDQTTACVTLTSSVAGNLSLSGKSEVLDAVRLASPEMEGAAFHLREGKDCYSECFANGWLAP